MKRSARADCRASSFSKKRSGRWYQCPSCAETLFHAIADCRIDFLNAVRLRDEVRVFAGDAGSAPTALRGTISNPSAERTKSILSPAEVPTRPEPLPES